MSTELSRAVALLQAGELVAFPTETVYGLGADAANSEAIAKIFAAKKRPADHPLIVHLPSVDFINEWAQEIPATALALADAFWPGPLTLILKRHPQVPHAVTGGQETVGLRVPAHPLALDLLRAYANAGGGKNGLSGIAAPSANRFGRISPTQATHVKDELGDAVSLILDGGACAIGIESTILDLSGEPNSPPRLLRPGHISAEQLAAVLGVFPKSVAQSAVINETSVKTPTIPATCLPRVSGSLESHYAPATPLKVIPSKEWAAAVARYNGAGKSLALLRCGATNPADQPAKHSHHQNALPRRSTRTLPCEAAAYAHGFYSALRDLDEAGCDLILVEAPPQSAEWIGVNDRLRRAAFDTKNRPID